MNIPIAKPYFDEDESLAMVEPLATGWVVQGPKVKAFEHAVTSYTGAGFGLATTSCTSSLHLSLLACGVVPGDEIIVPSFTFVASANAVEYIGAKPVFVDIDLETFNIDVTRIEEAITSRTKAIMPVHLFGLSADMDPLMEIARNHGLRVIEDAACAIGSYYRGQHAGTIGDAGCFSFHPRKSITTGEGGMVITNNLSIARKVEILRDHGAEITDLARHEGSVSLLPEYNLLGFNYRMTDFQGALGIAQMRKLPQILNSKRDLAAQYTKVLAGSKWLRPPVISEGYSHGFQAYVCLFGPEEPTFYNVNKLHRQRNELMTRLAAMGVATRPGTHAPVILGYYAQKYGLRFEEFPNAYIADRLSVALPLYAKMTEAEQTFVCESIQGALNE